MRVWFRTLLIISGIVSTASFCCAEDKDVVGKILGATNYTAELFSLLDSVKEEPAWRKISESSALRGVRLMAVRHVDEAVGKALLAKEVSVVKPDRTEEKLHIGEFYLGMGVEDAYALLLSRYSSVKPRLYLDDEVLCIADANGQDLVWANAKSREVHWLTLTPSIVRRIVGFKTGSFSDLRRAVETKLDVSFTTDMISKGEICQQVGTLDTVDGETLRYFIGAMSAGEEFTRTVRKTVNQHAINFELTSESGVGALLANTFEDAMQKDENAQNAKSPRFAPRGSLQLQWTQNAVQGDWNSAGGSRRNRLRTSASDLQPLNSELEGALNQLNSLSF